MEQCVAAIKDWCSSRRLQLNADKMEVNLVRFQSEHQETFTNGYDAPPWLDHCRASYVGVESRSLHGW